MKPDEGFIGTEASARVLAFFIPCAAAGMLAGAIADAISRNVVSSVVLAVGAAIAMGLSVLARAGARRGAFLGLLAVTLVAFTVISLKSRFGIHDVALLPFGLVVTVAGLLLGRRDFLVVTGVTLVIPVVLILLEIDGATRNLMSATTEYGDIVNVTAVLALTAAVARWMGSSLVASLNAAEHAVRHDGLTELPNRLFFQEDLQRAVERARVDRSQVAVLRVDFDRFKKVNDALGSAAGDAVLKEAGRRIVEEAGPGACVARQGGDEFLVRISGPELRESAQLLATRLGARLAVPYRIGPREVVVTAASGLAVWPSDASDAEALKVFAAMALHEAKRRGANRWATYEPGLRERDVLLLRVEEELRRALEVGGLFLQYQPLIQARTRRLAGFEALVRLRSASGETWHPGRFIEVAEQAGLGIAVGEWVLEHVCAQVREWMDAGLETVPVSLNVSPRQLQSGTLPIAFGAAIERHRIPPGQLGIELTEGAIMELAGDPAAELRKLRSLGAGVAIDDFGTGYSSLSHLRRLPVDVLKIDRLFLKEIPDVESARAILKAIISMAHAIGVRVVAEGVQSEEQLAFLEATDCDLMQGFLFARPLDADAATAALHDRQAGRSLAKLAVVSGE